MSRLEISSVKYKALDKWKTLGNKADGASSLLSVVPNFEILVNNAVKEHAKNIHSNKKLTPMFTDESGKAVQKVKRMQQSFAEEYER